MPNAMDPDRLRRLLARAVEPLNSQPPSHDELTDLAHRRPASKRLAPIFGGVAAVVVVIVAVFVVFSIAGQGGRPHPLATQTTTSESPTDSPSPTNSPTSTATTSSPTATTSDSAPACKMTNVHISVVIVPYILGHNLDVRGFYLSNTGESPCSMNGYPSLVITQGGSSAVPMSYAHYSASDEEKWPLASTLQKHGNVAPVMSGSKVSEDSITVDSGSRVAFFLLAGTFHCDAPLFATLHISGAATTGSISISHINGFCPHHTIKVTPVMKLGPNPLPIESPPPGVKWTESATNGPTSTLAIAAPACNMTNIHASFANLGESTPLTEDAGVSLTNTGDSPCSLDGYPTLSITLPNGSDSPWTIRHWGESAGSESLLIEHMAKRGIIATTTYSGNDTLSSEKVTLAPDDSALLFMENQYTQGHPCHTPHVDLRGVTWRLSGASATGSLTTSHVRALIDGLCGPSVLYVTPVMKSGSNPLPTQPHITGSETSQP